MPDDANAVNARSRCDKNMAPQIYRRPQVPIDLIEAATYIARDCLAAAERFLDAAEECFRELARTPDLGTEDEFSSRHLRGIRRWRIKGFEKHLVFYRPVDDGIEIVCVLHGARDIEGVFDAIE